MISLLSGDCDPTVIKATVLGRKKVPFFQTLIQAGFPSPATDYVEKVCDLNDLCITHPEATYFVRVIGDSMSGARIEPGDILIVDSSRDVVNQKIVVAWYNGELTVKRIQLDTPPLIVLLPANPNYLPIYVQPDDAFDVLGIVTFVIQKPL